MELAHDTWVVIADGEKYILMRNVGDSEMMDLRVVSHEDAENPATYEQGTDRPGRFDDAGLGKSAVDETDWHTLGKERFAGDLSERLTNAALANSFRKLVIVADASTLGTLRKHYHDEVSERLVAEIDKDLTNHPVPDIERHIANS